MGTIANLYNKAKQENILAGIIISDLIAFISYVIFPAGIIFYGDFQMIIGVIIGTRFALKNLKTFQSPLKYGILAALGGTILSAISMSIYDWTIFSLGTGIENSLLYIILFYLLEALIIGLFIGLVQGLYYRSKYPQKENKNNETLNELYESLKSN